MMRGIWRTCRNATYVLLVAVAVVLVAIWWRELMAIWRDQALTFIVTVVLMICGTLVQARNFLVFLEAKQSFSVWRFARVWAVSALANYVAPLQPGIAVRVAWLTKHDINIATSLLATWRQLVASCWVALAGLAIGLLLTGDARGRWPSLVLGLGWLATLALRELWLRWLDRLKRPVWIVRRKELLHRAAVGITFSGLAGVVVQYVLGTLILYWVYDGFGAEIGIGQALILTCLIYLSSLVTVLPGNLGVTEAIYMLGGHGFGLSVAAAGALAILMRIAHVSANVLVTLTGIRHSKNGSEVGHT